MFQKPRDPDINEKDPFSDDKLERKQHAENLKNFIQNSPDNFVMSLNSPWGTGKTFFLTRLAQLLRNDQHLVLYFNAWESDFAPHPLTAFISEIQGLWEEEKIIEKKTFNNIRKSGTQIIKNFAPAAIQLATFNLLSAEALKDAVELAKGSEKTIADSLAKQVDRQPDEYKKTKDAIKDLKEALTELVNSAKKKQKKTPVVIIIDELDRCRPSYAVELLETVKHIFDVPNVVFLLGTDRKQLGHSVRTLYGANMDSDNYLRRFIDIEYQLPVPTDQKKFTRYLFAKWNIKQNVDDHETVTQIFQLFSIPIRTQQQLFSKLEIIISIRDAYTEFPILFFLLLLHETQNDLFKDFSSKSITCDELIKLLSKDNNLDDFFISKRLGILIRSSLFTYLSTDLAKEHRLENLYKLKQEIIEKAKKSNVSTLQRKHKDINYELEVIDLISEEGLNNIIKSITLSLAFDTN